ncbi:50S ribosomal protein L29 [Candidatus Giovannonibacteria bacterium]|nr:50S ribosomal protein L29 [Candidatus Giovannonibacteria bacterium]
MSKAKTKSKEIKEKSEAELLSMLSDEREKLLGIRMRREGTSLKNVKEQKEIRKTIARILTVYRANK